MQAVQGGSVSTALLCLVALLATGCATAPTPRNRLYSGDALPQDRLAVLIASRSGLYKPQPLIRQIDGQEIERSDDGAACVELLPGIHVVAVGAVKGEFLLPSRFSTTDMVLRLHAEAGHTYEVKIKASTKDKWEAEIIDNGTVRITPSQTTPPRWE